MVHLPRAMRTAALTVAVALGASLALLGAAGPVHAADNGSWSVAPTPPKVATTAPRNYFILEGDPGAVIEDSVRIQNWTEGPISFRLYGADGYNTPEDGFFAVRDHVGGVVALNVKVESTSGGDALDVGIRRAVAARMYVRVSGVTSPGLEVHDVLVTHDRGAWPWSGRGVGTVTYTVENTGNLRLSPEGRIKVSGLFADDRDRDTKPLVDLLPGQKVTLTQDIFGVPWLGQLKVGLDLTAGDDLMAGGEVSTWIVPWPFLLAVVVLLMAVGGAFARRTGVLRRKLRAAEEAPKISVTTGA